MRNPLNKIIAAVRVITLRARLRGRIEVGFDTQVGPGCHITVAKGGVVRLHGAVLSRSVTLEASSNAVLEIGQTFIGPGAIVSARNRIVIGDGCGLSDYVTVRDHNHVHDAENPLSAWEYSTDPIIIKNDVWIASKATVVAGVTIEEHALCGAGAVITHDVQAWQRVGGVPARPLGSSHKNRQPLAAHPGHPAPTNLAVGELAGLATERHSARLSLRNAGKPNPPLSFGR
jgi:acetyltransferase-like isoleucine patch superfamily enzyme